jgi:hypothetical protein
MQQQTRTLTLCRFVGMPGVAMAILLSFSQTGFAEEVSWKQRPGLGLSLSGNAAGALSVVGVDRVGESGYSVHKFNGTDWTRITGAGNRVAVSANGDIWLINEQHNIFRYTAATSAWQLLPGLAIQIAAGGDGSVWVMGINKTPGGYAVYRWDGSNWALNSGGITSIAVSKEGTVWAVNDQGRIFWYNQSNGVWNSPAGTAHSVHTGASSGAVWITGTTQVPGGYALFKWNPAANSWDPYSTFGAVEITEAAGTPWILQSDGDIFSKQEVAITTYPGTIVVDGYAMPPMQPAQPRVSVGSDGSGQLLCSAADGGTAFYCGNTKADYVGAYTFNTECKEGFYDLIYGGTCWKCPDDDGKGEWLRSADAVDKATACWRAPKETLSAATKVKSPAWAWDCPSGSFWDSYSPDGLGGSCWKCPDDYPRRTGFAINSSQACATPTNETRAATLLTFNGCPTPDAKTMGLPGKRTPGKPFLDIAAGWSQGVISGGCYACPVVDEGGNFLVSSRNYSPIYDKDNNLGCRIDMKWKPSFFNQPGLSGLAGIKEIIWENRLFEKDRITTALYAQAASRGITDAAQAKPWVTDQWKAIAAAPYSSEPFRLKLFALMKAGLAKDAVTRTPAEKLMIASFASYIRNEKTYVAQQGLAMYDAWKAYSDAYKAATGESRTLESLFYYGTVPLDFDATLGSILAVGGTGSGLVGAMVAVNGINKLIDGWEEFIFLQNGLKIFEATKGLYVVTGASLVQAAGAILTSIAVDQFVEIQTARTKLEASLAAAQQPVDLDQLSKATNGEDMLYYFWGKAMDGTELEDQQVVSVAAGAYAAAQQKGFVKP